MPRIIQTNPCVSRFSGQNRLMEPKATTSPSGRENASVKKKIFTVSQKPLSSSIVTGRNIMVTSLQRAPVMPPAPVFLL